jgi:hypothetical protein
VSGIDADGKPFTANGKSMEVVRRQPDGTWRFVIDNPHGGEQSGLIPVRQTTINGELVMADIPQWWMKGDWFDV